ncbi:MAG: 5-formyltetrahydrofolate cyclo-ligase [Bacteroidales bacterium]|nr:5-formyltetrahydrofolate cyclo-ligase [Bacteroidales bacterium]
MNKLELRKHIRAQFLANTSERHAAWSQLLCQKLIHLETIQKAQVIAAFWPMPDEVDIRPVLHHLSSRGKKILLPKVVNDVEMTWHKFEGEETMLPDSFGILTPTGADFADYGKIDVVLVPGRAFDAQCHRMGRGKGYYDRFLSLTPAFRIGIGFPYQLVDEVPIDPHDLPMNMIVL